MQAQGQSAAARLDAEFCTLWRFMEQHGIGEQLGQAPVVHHGGGDVEMGVAEGFLLQFRQCRRELSAGLHHQLAITLGVQGGQCHAPDIGEQANGKHLGGRCGPCCGSKQLRRDTGGCRA